MQVTTLKAKHDKNHTNRSHMFRGVGFGKGCESLALKFFKDSDGGFSIVACEDLDLELEGASEYGFTSDTPACLYAHPEYCFGASAKVCVKPSGGVVAKASFPDGREVFLSAKKKNTRSLTVAGHMFEGRSFQRRDVIIEPSTVTGIKLEELLNLLKSLGFEEVESL